ncbi:TraR/DksA family transcriptional regulator [Colwellia sp. BRX10-3]|uniref:TraR/DksA family transcriptional regulator n=1 Tax=Colwellia sp. BRX10-3 TaxID=2759844 RepID=UPI0015F4D88F|nr:TraR/DksA C4-type zinc finger protein [Colwellia sp. BRX10-3]MBA6390100.1 TraR/DksA family transcriptional regulator [Colwellia sp. BRX10-3]
MNKENLNNLFNKRIELQQRISAVEDDFRKGRSQDFSEQTSENENNEVLNEIYHQAKLELTLVEQAITRNENSEYGFCSQCNQAINPDRLRILPYIDTCSNCAK